MSITSVRLQPDVEQGLDILASDLQRSKSWVINEAVREYLQRQDQQKARWQETLKAMDSVAKGQVVSSAAVDAWLESWGTEDELPPPKAGA